VSWDTLVDWEPHINWEGEQSSIQIIIPEHRELRIQNLPPRFSRVGITFHVFVGDYTNMSEEIRIYPAKTIFVKPQEKHKRLQTRLLIELFEDSLIAIVGTAQYFSFNGQDGSDSASFNKQHYASNIIECLHIRRGRLLASGEKPIDRLVPLVDTNLDQGAEWESD